MNKNKRLIQTYFKYKQDISKNRKIGVSNLKKHKNASEQFYLLSEFLKLKEYRKIIFNNPFPNDITKLGKETFYPRSDSLEKNITWHTYIITSFSEEINWFLKLRRKFDQAMLLNNYEKANLLLNEVEVNFGYSLWLIENKTKLFEFTEGTEKQKEYINKLVKDKNIDLETRFISFINSTKIEREYSSRSYKKGIRDLFSSPSGLNPDLIELMEFQLDMFRLEKVFNYETLVTRCSCFSVIDQYLNLIKIFQHMLITDFLKEKEWLSIVKKATDIIGEKIEDEVIKNIRSIFFNIDISDKDREYEEINRILDLYTKGEYSNSKIECKRFLNEFPDRLEIVIIYIKSVVKLGEHFDPNSSNLLDTIIFNIYNLVIKNEDSYESYLYLQKIYDVFGTSQWVQFLFFIFYTDYYHNQFDGTAKTMIKFALMNSFTNNPYRLLYFKDSNKIAQKTRTGELLEIISHKDLERLNNLNIPLETKDKYEANILNEYDHYELSWEVSKKYITSENLLLKHDAQVGLVNYYIRMSDFNRAINTIVDLHFENPHFHVKLPIKELLDKIEMMNSIDDIKKNISLPILYELYSRLKNNDKEYYIAESYEDFLDSYNLNKPSQIAEIIDLFDIKKIGYFLDNVCVSHIMDTSVVFQSTEEIEKERISVCQLLIKIDLNNSSRYLEEIKNITHRIMIRTGIREIEESKIYVDVEGIKKHVEITLKEKYTRFLNMFDIEFFDTADGLSFFNEYKLNETIDGSNEYLYRPTNAKKSALFSLISEIRNNFVTSHEYGLDGHLSNSIRHGTIQGQLRMSLEKNNLITQKDNLTNVYKDNDYWKERLKNHDPSTTEEIMSYLAEFSKGIDDHIDHIKNNLLQIKTEINNNQKGIFAYLIYLNEFEPLYNNIVEDKLHYEDFFDLVINYLWKKTDVNLDAMRKEINSSIKDFFYMHFDKLQKNIELLKIGEYIDESIGDLKEAIINSKTQMQYELDNVANWFKRTQISSYSDYETNFPIEIAAKVINNIYPNHTFEPEIKITSENSFIGKSLKNFVDIYFILFDNIIKHCSSQRFSPNVLVQVEVENNMININVRNAIESTTDLEILSSKLSEINESLENNKSFEGVSKEGGTGFYKINKIISVDLNCRKKIKVNHDDKHFIVDINMDGRKLIT